MKEQSRTETSGREAGSSGVHGMLGTGTIRTSVRNLGAERLMLGECEAQPARSLMFGDEGACLLGVGETKTGMSHVAVNVTAATPTTAES